MRVCKITYIPPIQRSFAYKNAFNAIISLALSLSITLWATWSSNPAFRETCMNPVPRQSLVQASKKFVHLENQALTLDKRAAMCHKISLMHVTSPAVLAQGIHKSSSSEAGGITGSQKFLGHISFQVLYLSLLPTTASNRVTRRSFNIQKILSLNSYRIFWIKGFNIHFPLSSVEKHEQKWTNATMHHTSHA